MRIEENAVTPKNMETLTLGDLILPDDVFNDLCDQIAGHKVRIPKPNWVLVSAKLTEEYPQIKKWDKVYNMKVFITNLPDGIDLLTVSIQDA